MKDYHKIALCFENALDGRPIPAPFAGAIKAMKLKPELCDRIPNFDDTLWSIIEDFLNSGGSAKDEDYFIQAVALLDS